MSNWNENTDRVLRIFKGYNTIFKPIFHRQRDFAEIFLSEKIFIPAEIERR